MNQEKRTLRLWPGVVIVLFQWLARYVVPAFVPEAMPFGAIAGLGAGVAIIAWWLLFSRAAWTERVGAIVVMIAALAVTPQFLHVSIATGAMGFLYPMYAVPLLCLAFVAWAVLTRNATDTFRRATMVAAIAFGCGVLTLLRTDGITGDGHSLFAWRWSPTAEEQLLTGGVDELTEVAPVRADIESEADWPGFRGPNRDSVVPGVRIETDWSANPPVELWRQSIGPGWSSFAVRGDLIYTQEQRGDDEIVACYDATTGEPVWRHRDPARFYESNGGAGPRGTPTLRDGRVYTFGATGILNVLDAADGSLVWSRDVGDDTGVAIPGWGFASSPLIVGDDVLVAAAGKLAAYARTNGEPRWFGPDGKGGYSSPHLMTLDGVEQVVLASDAGLTGFDPAGGDVLWQHDWVEGTRIVQPALTGDGDLLLSGGEARGMRRISVAREGDAWTSEERWTSIRLKPYFNDFVVHEGHAFGFDGRILACIDAATGERKWKGGRYGHGQLLLLPEQDVLLVISEQGELALVEASADGFTELARFEAIQSKTWNHPVLVGDRVLIRNGEEMAAFRLSFPAS